MTQVQILIYLMTLEIINHIISFNNLIFILGLLEVFLNKKYFNDINCC